MAPDYLDCRATLAMTNSSKCSLLERIEMCLTCGCGVGEVSIEGEPAQHEHDHVHADGSRHSHAHEHEGDHTHEQPHGADRAGYSCQEQCLCAAEPASAG